MFYILKKIIPKPLRRLYHRLLSDLANAVYLSPSERLIVIGVTGTSGKSTVCFLLAKMLEQSGFRVGVASTILFKVDKKEWLNDKKMTMVGRFALQRLLADMAEANCQYAIIETTSEGIAQFRHGHIAYDVVVCTNLYPEHIESHGNFENYKNAKLTIFRELAQQPRKVIAGQTIKKVIVVNLDDEHAGDFLQPPADLHLAFTTSGKSADGRVISAHSLRSSADGISFVVDQQVFHLGILGLHNVSNAIAAVSVGISQGLSIASISQALETVSAIPGRQEFIRAGQPFTVIVDYAFESKAMSQLYEVARQLAHDNIIHVLGGTGGGRDRSRRMVIGKLAGEKARTVIVTNEDPYDEDPAKIMEEVAQGARSAGKLDGVDLHLILDRRAAIAKALSLAGQHDIVLVTGKGSEQAIVERHGRKIPWDDRQVVREELARVSVNS